ncbi:MAG TPA: hypothetical protein VFK57_16735 [Vicinamibacterales bacterium]|nr:hypothetical protein [Vicinamibacterales bacterium]
MPSEVLSYIAYAAAGAAAALFGLRLFWRTLGYYKVKKAGPRPLFGVRHRLWRDPGAVESLDLIAGPGGPSQAPAAPYRFIEEHSSGTQPCVSVRDANGRRWRVKWGPEVPCETFAVRLAWACGYFAEVTHRVAAGRVEEARALTRAASCLDEHGAFVDARFELDDPEVLKLFEEHSWSWTDNPFLGTRELAGLKILLMLISNWDNKDQRDVARGSNTAIYVTRVSRWRREAQYLIVDWGGSMGRWGNTVVTRGRWDAAGFAAQTPSFVTGVTSGYVQFGYTGQRTGDARANITPEDARWLCRYLGRVTDAQLRAALRASGATPEEEESFTASLRSRIEQLRAV